MNSRPDDRVRSTVARRAVLQGIAVAGAGVVVAGSGAKRAAATAASLQIDVACIVDTFRFIAAPDSAPPLDGAVYGSPFIVEGQIYEGGTIPSGNGFDPTSRAATGRWICRGWILIRDDRPEPHVATTQLYALGPFGAGQFPVDQLASEGVEGADSPGWAMPRIVMGGTGRYAGARGVVTQSALGTNTTQHPVAGAGPNFRFDFDLL